MVSSDARAAGLLGAAATAVRLRAQRVPLAGVLLPRRLGAAAVGADDHVVDPEVAVLLDGGGNVVLVDQVDVTHLRSPPSPANPSVPSPPPRLMLPTCAGAVKADIRT